MEWSPQRRLIAVAALLIGLAAVALYLARTWSDDEAATPTGETGTSSVSIPSEPPDDQANVSLVDRTWKCDEPQDGTLVEVTITGTGNKADAVHLNQGCTGEVTLHLVIEDGWDCIKVHGGAHDLVVRGFCEIHGRVGDVHQDFVQAMGGTDVTFEGFETRNAGLPGQNGGGGEFAIHSSFFVNQGRGGNDVPTGIVCDGCTLDGGGTPVAIGNSVSSGVRNSTIKASTKSRCVELVAGHGTPAAAPIDDNNTCI